MTLMAVWAIARWRIAKIFFDGLGPEFSHNPAMMVRSRRLELPRPFGHNDLNVARLPVPPRPHIMMVRIGSGTR